MNRPPFLSAIVVMAHNGVIGDKGGLPWRLPADLRHFRETTMGHAVVMGRRTWESIGRPLAGRRNLVLTRDPAFCPPLGCEAVRSVDELFARLDDEGEAFVIGGAQIYRLLLPWTKRLYITRIDHEFEGDAYFPDVDWSRWRLVSQRPGVTDERNPYRYEFLVYERAETDGDGPSPDAGGRTSGSPGRSAGST